MHCQDCRYYLAEPGALERALPGMAILSSAYGSVRADTGVCECHARMTSARGRCDRFLPRSTPTALPSQRRDGHGA